MNWMRDGLQVYMMENNYDAKNNGQTPKRMEIFLCLYL